MWKGIKQDLASIYNVVFWWSMRGLGFTTGVAAAFHASDLVKGLAALVVTHL